MKLSGIIYTLVAKQNVNVMRDLKEEIDRRCGGRAPHEVEDYGRRVRRWSGRARTGSGTYMCYYKKE